MDAYDRAGRPITFREWAVLCDDEEYKRVAVDTVGEAYTVSTVWLGLDHSYMPGPPVIFETKVFPAAGWHNPRDAGWNGTGEASGLVELDCVRYSTEEDAIQGHAEMVALIRSTAAASYDLGLLDDPDDPSAGPSGRVT